MLINADISGLYLVQISGVWGSSSPQHNHCFSSYTVLTTAANSGAHCCTKQHTVTCCYTHCL